MQITVKLEGVARVQAKMEGLSRGIQRRVVYKSVNAGGTPFINAVRAKAPVRNRVLKRSLTKVVRRYNGAAVALIGQEKGKQIKYRRKKTGGIGRSLEKFGLKQAVPIHLVENAVQAHTITGAREKRVVEFKDVKGRKRKRKEAVGIVLRALAIGAPAGLVFRRRVRHPGHTGTHFVRAAAASSEAAGIRAFEEKYVEGVLQEA